MRILIVAFSCAPNAGSEAGVAWNWLKSLAAKAHELTVLTPTSKRERIAPAAAQSAALKRISFRYIGSARLEMFARKSRLLLQIYYVYWQWRARRVALRISRETPFDVVHAITIGGVRFPAFLSGVARQFVLGPIGGGETAPIRLTDAMGRRVAFFERIRHAANGINRYDPLMRVTFRGADRVLVKTAESTMAIPLRYRSKCVVQHEIGADEREIALEPLEHREGQALSILYAGRYLHWKGMEFGLKAFAKLLESCPDASLSLTGGGPAEVQWKALAAELGVADHIAWLGWSKYDDMPRVYRGHHALLFPSLHEASGNVIVEAFAVGLPVICFKLGGPGLLVDDRVGRAVDVSAANYDEAVDRLAAALRSLAALDADAYRQVSRNALERAHAMVWDRVVGGVYGRLEAQARPADSCAVTR
jgi:glycosyltransferase involved in cell wall biosynthesis